MNYHPDRWVKVELSINGNKQYRVFAGWYGGYTSGDSWKLSSPIVTESVDKDSFIFDNESGSKYICHKNCYGTSGYMSIVFESLTKSLKTSQDDYIKILEGPDNA